MEIVVTDHTSDMCLVSFVIHHGGILRLRVSMSLCFTVHLYFPFFIDSGCLIVIIIIAVRTVLSSKVADFLIDGLTDFVKKKKKSLLKFAPATVIARHSDEHWTRQFYTWK